MGHYMARGHRIENGLRKYVNQVIRSGKLEYNGTGKERREYIHVLDAARLSVDVLDNTQESSNYCHRATNLEF